MARHPRCRMVCKMPISPEFIPSNVGENEQEFILCVEEYEALRLIDVECFSQEECSKYMDVARTTVQQIYSDARKKVSSALVEGRKLRIEGGSYRLCDGKEEACGCGGCKRHKRNKGCFEKECTSEEIF